MTALYFLGGIDCLIFGVCLTKRQVKIFAKGKQDELGFDIKLLTGGILFIVIGVSLIVKYM